MNNAPEQSEKNSIFPLLQRITSVLFVILLVSIGSSVSAAIDALIWKQSYSNGLATVVRSIIQTPDGGYLLAGASKPLDGHWYDGWLARLDRKGKRLWEKQFGGVYDDWFSSVVPLQNGDYLLAGGSDPDDNPNRSDAWLVRLDKDGELLWQHRFGGNNEDVANAVVQVADGFLLVGLTQSVPDSLSNGSLIRLNAAGDILWNRQFGSELMSAYPIADGGFLVIGKRCVDRYASETICDGLLTKLDKQGKIIWQHDTEGEDNVSEILSVQGENGDMLLALINDENSGRDVTRLLFIQTEKNNVRQTILPIKFDGSAQALIATGEGGYAMTGALSAESSSRDKGWFVTLDALGHPLSEVPVTKCPEVVLQNRKGSFLFAGGGENSWTPGWWIIMNGKSNNN